MSSRMSSASPRLALAVLLALQLGSTCAQAQMTQGGPIPLPPPRPPGLGAQPAAPQDAPPATPQSPRPAAPAAAAIERSAAPPKAATMDAAGAIQRANAWFNSSPTLVSDFVQIGADGRRTEGKLYVLKPGRLRFEYASPATLEIIADGTSVAVRDRRLATQDVYFISQTPLKFLLKEQTDLGRDTKILGVALEARATIITLEDKATFGGVSRLTLVFDPQTSALKQWTVLDPQGYETLVSLSNVDLKSRPPAELFKINTERFN
jgi:outer membrane lipoprotein-sorting protein